MVTSADTAHASNRRRPRPRPRATGPFTRMRVQFDTAVHSGAERTALYGTGNSIPLRWRHLGTSCRPPINVEPNQMSTLGPIPLDIPMVRVLHPAIAAVFQLSPSRRSRPPTRARPRSRTYLAVLAPKVFPLQAKCANLLRCSSSTPPTSSARDRMVGGTIVQAQHAISPSRYGRR